MLARNQLCLTDRALLDIATLLMQFSLFNLAIVAPIAIAGEIVSHIAVEGIIVMFIAVSDSVCFSHVYRLLRKPPRPRRSRREGCQQHSPHGQSCTTHLLHPSTNIIDDPQRGHCSLAIAVLLCYEVQPSLASIAIVELTNSRSPANGISEPTRSSER